MIADPVFWLLAIPAVLLVGIGKGGFGGGIGIVGVPMMAFAVGPVRAAAILLPILIAMDFFAVRRFRWRWDRTNLAIILPGAVLGVALGAVTFRSLTVDEIRIVIGTIGAVFALHWFVMPGNRPARPADRARGTFWATLSGFTSFGVHAGGPPINVYLLPQQLDRTTFQATTVAFFAVVNALKLPAYAWLGQFGTGDLLATALLLPLAPAGIAAGAWLHARVNERWFYRIVYAFLLLMGLQLIRTGVTGWLAAHAGG